MYSICMQMAVLYNITYCVGLNVKSRNALTMGGNNVAKMLLNVHIDRYLSGMASVISVIRTTRVNFITEWH